MSQIDPESVQVHPPNPTFQSLARFVLRFRWPMLLLTFALTGGAAYVAKSQIRIDTSIEAFAANDSKTQKVLERYRDEFGRDDVFLLLIEGEVFSPEYVKRLRTLHEVLEGLDIEVGSLGERRADREARRKGVEAPKAAPEPKADDAFGDFGGGDDEWGEEGGGSVIEEVTSLINVRKVRGRSDGIDVGDLMDPFPTDAELPALKKTVLADRSIVGQVVGPAATHSVIVIRAHFMNENDTLKVEAEVAALAEKYTAPGFKVTSAGLPALNSALNELMLGDLGGLARLSAIAVVLILGFLFRHPAAVIGPLMVVAMAVLTTFGYMGASDTPVTMLSTILPAFISCVGIGDSVHLISVFRDYLKGGMERRDAIVAAVATTGVPILFTTLTTMVGLLSFRFASLAAIEDLGTAGAIGVFVAMVHSLVFLPIVLSFTRKTRLGAKEKGAEDNLDRFLHWCLDLSGLRVDDGLGPEPPKARKRRRNTLLAGVWLVVAAVVGMSLLHVYHNPLAWVPEQTPIKIAFDTMDREIGGTGQVQLLIEGTTERGVKDRELLLGLEKLEAYVKAYEHPGGGVLVGNSISLLDIIKETNQALHGGDPAFYKLPETQRAIDDALFLFTNAGPDALRRMATLDLGKTQMTIRVRWMDATSYLPLTEYLEAGIKKYVPASGKVSPTGSVYTLVTTVGTVIGDLSRRFGTAFLLITIIMALLLRSLKLGVVAMVPNLMPILAIMGLMGFAGIPIDLNNLLIASIAIGVAVDDTIHYLHHFRVIHDHGECVEAAVRRAASHAGRAMVSTTVALAAGFFVYQGSAMANIQRFGLLIGLTCIMALLIDLIFAPALLRSVYPRRES